MKNIILIYLLTVASLSCFAQEDDKIEKLESARIALITQRLDLKPAQAEKFWPLYNEYTTKRKELRKSIRQMKKTNNTDATDEELKKYLNNILDAKQKDLDLEKQYIDKFLKVLSTKQTVELVKAEKEFMTMVYKKMAEKNRK